MKNSIFVQHRHITHQNNKIAAPSSQHSHRTDTFHLSHIWNILKVFRFHLVTSILMCLFVISDKIKYILNSEHSLSLSLPLSLSLSFGFSRHDISVKPWLFRSSLWRPGWPPTHRDLPLPSAGIKAMCHQHLLKVDFHMVR